MSNTNLTIQHPRCDDLTEGRITEWMIGNGNGGFAMASVNQMLTRRYHGLLVAAIDPPLERFVLLGKLDATVVIDGLTYELATNDYPEAVHPQGHRLLESFSLRPFPTWNWRTGQALIQQTLCMVDGEDTTFVQYRLIEGPESVNITVRPLCTSRHFHVLASKNDIGWATVEEEEDRLEFHWGGDRPGWQLSHNGSFKSRGDWYYQFVLDGERVRGYDHTQDLFMPGPISATLSRGEKAGLVIAASTRNRPWKHWQSAFERAELRDRQSAMLSHEDPLASLLARAADSFIVSRQGDLKTVIAGYPWFGDWGRDTFISLPGLCLVPGRYEDARSILETFSNYIDGGMIPNRFPDFGKPPSYNTTDAALWYIHSIDRYLTYTNDWSFVSSKMLPAISSILDSHERGTRHGIRLSQDGLLSAGEPGLALTWMDALVNGRAISPRIGKPVEINALWYNALEIASRMFDRAGDGNRAEYWRRLAARAKAAFNERFWFEGGNYLYDVVDVDGQAGNCDSSLRPNQLFAISLTHPVLNPQRWSTVLEVCEQRLLTPIGLRTLAPGSPGYIPRYEGNMEQRDSAYHQGTCWPWLFGAFITAYIKTRGDSPDTLNKARKILDGLTDHLCEAGIGSVSEVADADAPHRPGGCPWQAWSVAEPLRALCEDILRTHPAKIVSSPAKITTPRQPVA